MRHLPPILLSLVLAQALFSATPTAQTTPELTITGQVLDEAGKPASGARVYALLQNQPPGKGISSALSESDGEFLIRLSAPGRYAIVANKSDRSVAEGYMPQNQPFYRYPGATAEATLAEGDATRRVQLRLAPKNGHVTGRSLDASTNLPVEHVRITMCQIDDPALCSVGSAKSARGSFIRWAPHVPFTLTITADGYESWFAPDGVSSGAILSVPSGGTLELPIFLKRRPEAAGVAFTEAEKRAGVNLPAPSQLSPADNATLDNFPRHTKLEWSPVEGAASYTVEVDWCEGLMRREAGCVNPQPFVANKYYYIPPASGLTKTAYEFDFLGAQPGRWRVWAKDKEGREGFKSPWRTFFYLK
jgi:hypothetical protein